MRTLVFTLLLLSLLAPPVYAEPVPLTIWQKEKRIKVQPGQVITLQRQPFRLVFPLLKDESLAICGGVRGLRPDKLIAFEPGHGMAGPYDGFFLDWEAHHYLYYDPTDPRDRADLWDRSRGLCTWEVTQFYERVGGGVEVVAPERLQEQQWILNKAGFEPLEFTVRWAQD